jgi:UDP-2,3-diacylglucosamine pyrophosphatase LpxH
VLRLIMKKSQEGTRVVYIPGNHDHELHAFAGVEIRQHRDRAGRDPHHTLAGRRLLVLHGDQFDCGGRTASRSACCSVGSRRRLLGSIASCTGCTTRRPGRIGRSQHAL